MANNGAIEHTQTDRPPGITCPKYVRGEGKRCQHYVATGGCALPEEAFCIEWLKVNPRAAAQAPPARDLFGNALREAPLAPAKPALTQASAQPKPQPGSEPAGAKQIRGLTTEDIESFKALGVEVCFESEGYGELWLVPAYTGQPRQEIIPENLATFFCVATVFPGSRVIGIEKQKRPVAEAAPGEARKERPA